MRLRLVLTATFLTSSSGESSQDGGWAHLAWGRQWAPFLLTKITTVEISIRPEGRLSNDEEEHGGGRT